MIPNSQDTVQLYDTTWRVAVRGLLYNGKQEEDAVLSVQTRDDVF